MQSGVDHLDSMHKVKTGNFGSVGASDLEPSFLRLRKGKDAVPYLASRALPLRGGGVGTEKSQLM